MNTLKFKKPNEEVLEEAVASIFSESPLFLYFKKKILKKFSSNLNSTLYIAKENNRVIGFAFLVFLEWDSNIFGFKIGRIENLSLGLEGRDKNIFLNNIIGDCIKDRYAHINCRIGLNDFGNLHALEKLEFNVMDMQLTLTTPDRFDISLLSPKEFIIREASSDDLERLEQIVKGVFTDTRFVIDSKYPQGGVNKLYFEWIKNSFLDPGQFVFVIQDKNSKDLIGCCVCNIDPDSEETLGIRIGSIDLIAIIKGYRNKGIGSMFIKFVLDWFKAKVDKVEIRTQVSNIAAIKAFMRSGFKEFSSGIMLPAGISLHRWF